jgi:hypothetical protein
MMGRRLTGLEARDIFLTRFVAMRPGFIALRFVWLPLVCVNLTSSRRGGLVPHRKKKEAILAQRK